MPLQKIRAEECLATVGVFADHTALLSMVSLVTPTNTRQDELSIEHAMTDLRCSARVYDWRLSARTHMMSLTRSNKMSPDSGEAAEHTYPSTFTVMYFEPFLRLTYAPCLGVVD